MVVLLDRQGIGKVPDSRRASRVDERQNSLVYPWSVTVRSDSEANGTREAWRRWRAYWWSCMSAAM